MVRNGDGDWLQPAFPIAGPARPMQLQVRTVWRGTVRVTGADFDAAQDRFEQDGAVEGLATVTGVWSGEQLQVERQTRQERNWTASELRCNQCSTLTGGLAFRHGCESS